MTFIIPISCELKNVESHLNISDRLRLRSLGVVQQQFVDIVLCVRVSAMYGMSRKVLFGLGGLLVACTLSSVAVIAAVDKGAKGVSVISLGAPH